MIALMDKIKNLLLTAVLILSPFTLYAQQHLSFMGVQMGQDIDSFVNGLVKKGLYINNKGKHIYGTDDDGNWATLSGAFWYFDDTDNILVKAPYIDKGVSFVQVMVRANRQTYQKLISALSAKYGKYRRSTNVQFNGDVKCSWITSKGNIEVWRSVFAKDDAQCNLEITYKDYLLVNRAKNKKNRRSNDL